jgi:hypothetical protein
MTEATTEDLSVVVDNMGGELLRALVDEVRTVPQQWGKLSEGQQAGVIERLRQVVRSETEKAVFLISKGEHEAARVKIESLTVKDGAKCVLQLGNDSKHEVLDYVGQHAVLLMCDPEQYFAAGDDVKPDADQPQLPLEEAAATHVPVTEDVRVGDRVRFLTAGPDGLVRDVRVVNRTVEPPVIEVTGLTDEFAIALFELVVTDPIGEVEDEQDEAA